MAKGYPVEVRGYASSKMDFQERCIREGEPWNIQARTPVGGTSVAAGAVNTMLTSASPLPRIGKCAWLESLTVTASVPMLVQVLVANDGTTYFANFGEQFIVGPSPVILPIKQLYRGYSTGGDPAGITLLAREVLGAAGPTNVVATLAVAGYRLTDDFDYDAPKTLLFAGDSTLDQQGPTLTGNVWPFVLKSLLFSSRKIRSRNVLITNSGSNTNDHEKWRKGGRYSSINRDAFFYTLGINDASTSIPTATSLANLQAAWAEHHGHSPEAPFIVVGISPLQNNTWEAKAATIRADFAAWVASVNNPKLKYISLDGVFDRTQNSTFMTVDQTPTPGNGTHYLNAGHALVAARVMQELEVQGIKI